METRALSPALKKDSAGFSPLTGINYVETYATNFGSSLNYAGFSPLTGINYVET